LYQYKSKVKLLPRNGVIKMKILFLNGSPRKEGSTARLMQYVAEGIDPAHTVEWVHAYDLAVKPCRACFECRPNGECVFPADDAHAVAVKIRQADALVIGSPTYFGNVTGPLKTLIDRCVTAFEEIAKSGVEMPHPRHTGKMAAMVASCNSPSPISMQPNQCGGTLMAMETVLKAGGYEIAGSAVLDGAVLKTEIPAEIREAARRLGAKISG
jgi:multimeric flavodoxin WrbA